MDGLLMERNWCQSATDWSQKGFLWYGRRRSRSPQPHALEQQLVDCNTCDVLDLRPQLPKYHLCRESIAVHVPMDIIVDIVAPFGDVHEKPGVRSTTFTPLSLPHSRRRR